MSNMPIENAAAAAASSGPQPTVGSNGMPVIAPLPSAQDLLQQVTDQQKAESAARPDTQAQPTYTPNQAASESGVSTTTFDATAQKALMHSMNRFVKAQNTFIHHNDLPPFAGAMEAHIIALTTALEQLGVL